MFSGQVLAFYSLLSISDIVANNQALNSDPLKFRFRPAGPVPV